MDVIIPGVVQDGPGRTQARILMNKAGGTAGPEAKNYRMPPLSTWMKAPGVRENDRESTLQSDGKSITIPHPVILRF